MSPSEEAKLCGIQVGGDLGSVPVRYLCSSCKLLMRDPVQAVCGHRYCKAAIPSDPEAIDCVACLDEGENPVLRLSLASMHSDAAMSRELNLTEFACPWGPECPVRRRLPELLTHADTECDYRQVPCNQCGRSVAASRLDTHREGECSNRPQSCSLCQELVPGARMSAHLDRECLSSTKQCESCPARVRDSNEAPLSHAWTECPVRWVDGESCPFGCGVIEDATAHRVECTARHLDLERIELLGLQKMPVVRQQQQQQHGTDVTGASAVERAAASEQLTSLESQLAEIESVITMGELAHNVHRCGLPHCPNQSTESADREAFFNRLNFAFTAQQELENEHRSMEQLLSSACRNVDPLMELKQRENEQLSRASYMYNELEMKVDRLVAEPVLALDRSISLQELGSTDGLLVWKIVSFRQRLADQPAVCSPFLFTEQFGYKLSAVAYLNGHRDGSGTHLSLFCRLCQGPYDAAQRWPFRRAVTFTLLDQTSGSHLVKVFQPGQSSQFQRPSQPIGQPFGYEKFAPKEDLETKGFLKDDVMFVRIQVSRPTLSSGDF